jgi:hypothetical protein
MGIHVSTACPLHRWCLSLYCKHADIAVVSQLVHPGYSESCEASKAMSLLSMTNLATCERVKRLMKASLPTEHKNN